MPESDDLEPQISSPPETAKEVLEKGTKDCVPALNAMAHKRKTPAFLRLMELMERTPEPGAQSIQDISNRGTPIRTTPLSGKSPSARPTRRRNLYAPARALLD